MKKPWQAWALLISLALCAPAFAAEEISLPQSDGGHRKMGGVGDRAKVIANGAPVETLNVATNVTTNTSTTPVAGVSGVKNFQWVITGTGSITQTAALKGSFSSDGSNAETLCTLTLSGTTTTYGTCDPFTAPFPYLFVTTTNTTGTGTSGTGTLGY